MPSILVSGATGQQGGGVIKALLNAQVPTLKILALTRNPESSAAVNLSRRGVEIVKGDLFDRDSLLAALKDRDAAYLVTDFRSAEDVPGEIRQGKLFIDCAKETGTRVI